MLLHRQFDRILGICKSFSKHIFNSGGNLPHCRRAPRCSDEEIIALSLFQEVRSIDSERRFFNALQSMLPDLYFRVGSRRNYNARKRRLACYIEQLRRPIAESLEAAESGNIKLIDSMPIKACRYSRAKNCKILNDDEQRGPSFVFCATQQQRKHSTKSLVEEYAIMRAYVHITA